MDHICPTFSKVQSVQHMIQQYLSTTWYKHMLHANSSSFLS